MSNAKPDETDGHERGPDDHQPNHEDQGDEKSVQTK